MVRRMSAALRTQEALMTTHTSSTAEASNGPDGVNQRLLAWVEKMADRAQPAVIHWCDGFRRSTTASASNSSTPARSRGSLRRSGATLIWRDQTPTTSRESRTARLSARPTSTTRDRRTTGAIQTRCARSCPICFRAQCGAERCTWSHSRWGRADTAERAALHKRSSRGRDSRRLHQRPAASRRLPRRI
jgi:hypothetical protein